MKKRWSYDRVVLALTVLFMLCAGMLLAVRLFLRGEWLVETENGYNDIVSDTTEEDARPDSLLPGEVMDLNRASVGDLSRLPGILKLTYYDKTREEADECGVKLHAGDFRSDGEIR